MSYYEVSYHTALCYDIGWGFAAAAPMRTQSASGTKHHGPFIMGHEQLPELSTPNNTHILYI